MPRGVYQHRRKTEAERQAQCERQLGSKRSDEARLNMKIAAQSRTVCSMTGRNHRSSTKRLMAFRKHQLFKRQEAHSRPEKLFGELLTGLGISFRRHKRLLLDHEHRRYYDVAIRRTKKLVELHGCYEHGCEFCGPKLNKRVLRNIVNDEVKLGLATKYGYEVLVVWEHELSDLSALARKVKAYIAS